MVPLLMILDITSVNLFVPNENHSLNNGPLQAKLLGGGFTQINGLFQTRACIQSLHGWIRLWQRFAAGDGLLMAVVCFGRCSASDDGPLMAVVRLITRSANGTGLLQAMVSGRSLLMTMVNLWHWSKAMVI